MKLLKIIFTVFVAGLAILLAIAGIVFVFVPLQFVPAVEPECQTDGNKEYYKNWFGVCFEDRDGTKRIDKSETIIAPLGHDLQWVEAVSATCSVAGNVSYYHCIRCDKKYSDQNCTNELSEGEEILEATGHATEIDRYSIIDEEGKHIAYCTNENCPGRREKCSYSEWSKVLDCTAESDILRSCRYCGRTETQKHIATSHKWQDWTEIEKATCTSKGLVRRECKNCKQSEERDLDLLNHSYEVSAQYWEEINFEPSTQNSLAKIPYHCSMCKQEFGAVEWSEDFPYADRSCIRIEDKNFAGTVIMFDSKIGSLGFNLSNMDDDLNEFDYVGYDSTAHVLTILTTYNAFQVKEVKIIGRQIPFAEMSITTGEFYNLPITLQNLSYVAPKGCSGLNLERIQTATLEIVGSVSIAGGEGSGNGITAKNLTIIGEQSSFSVKGGSGKNGENGAGEGMKESGYGQDGGIGIEATDLTININGSLSVVGGNGGAAFDRAEGDNDDDGSDGRPGYSGGNGGIGISVEKLTISKGMCDIRGGDGGEGGDASECNRKESVNLPNKKKKNDVVGGSGGAGGEGSCAVQAKTLEIIGGILSAKGGDGGDSGKRGGCHDNDHEGKIGVPKLKLGYYTTATDGSVGVAGSGANAFSSNCMVTGDRSLVKQDKGKDGSVVVELNQG